MVHVPAVTRPRSQIDMPPLHARGAPKKFTGNPHEVTRFLAHCKRLFTLNNVFKDLEKVESMAEYCSRSVIHILEGMKHYTTPNWVVLRNSFSSSPNVEDRLLAQDPKHDITVPFSEEEIVGIVDAKFKCGRFDDEIESGDSDNSDSDDEIEYKKKKKSKSSKAKPIVKKKVKHTREVHAHVPGLIPKVAAPAAPPTNGNSDDVGDLVKRLSKMSLDDQEYNYLYYKATRLDPLVAKCIRAPNLNLSSPPLPPLPQNNFRNNHYVAPPNQFGQNPNANQPQPPLQPGERTCWGCGDKGHGLWGCPVMAEHISKGDLRRGERGIEWKDGSLLQRFNQQGETLTMLISVNVPNSSEEELILPVFVQSTTSDDELSKMFSVTRSTDKQQCSAPYERPNTRTHVKKTGAELEGIPDSVKATKKLAEKTAKQEPTEASIPDQHPSDQIEHRVDFSREDIIMEDNEVQDTDYVLKAANFPPKLSKRSGPRQSAVSAFVDPRDILNQLLNSKMENISTGQLLAVSPIFSNALIKALQLKNSTRGPASANLLTEIFNIDQPSNNSENPPVTVSANQTPPPPPPDSIVAATFITRDSQHLIRLQVLINGKMVVAIVDTGSMLNVVSRAAWRTYMPHVSMDITRHINMGDANGGQAQLRGYLKDVSMVMGGVETTASFWVGEKVGLGSAAISFQLKNICDGTYLSFKDPESVDNRYKLLVDGGDEDNNNSSNLTNIPLSTMPGTYMMEVRSPAPLIQSTTDADESDSSINPASTPTDDIYQPISQGFTAQEESELHKEIFGDSDSDSGIYSSMPELESIPDSVSSHSMHPAHAQWEPCIWPMESPICPTCEAILHAGLFENVWKPGAPRFLARRGWGAG
ncbi:hypothetical protein B0H16DRAFT_1479145 [Mycena metata]|uniref:Uncharacterized protein n=1 Tax=Mycena metata TaxID=1033252 RepID=A0AAD7ME58_9AGAR|nr:hypothetical protein B0H16DRAFT_1479145 [Mycena metata]